MVLKVEFSNSLHRIADRALAVKLLWDECHRTLLASGNGEALQVSKPLPEPFENDAFRMG